MIYEGPFNQLLDSIKNDNVEIYRELKEKYDQGGIPQMGCFWNKILNKFQIIEVIKENDMLPLKRDWFQKRNGILFFSYGISSIEIETMKSKKKINTEKSVCDDICIATVDLEPNDPIQNIILNFYFNMAEPLVINVKIE